MELRPPRSRPTLSPVRIKILKMSSANYQSNKAWEEIQSDAGFQEFLCKDRLVDYLYQSRWFGGKSSRILQVIVSKSMPLYNGGDLYNMMILEVFFQESYAHNYFLPLALVALDSDISEAAKLAEVELAGKKYLLIDALYDQGFHQAMFKLLQQNQILKEGNNKVYFKAIGDLGLAKEFSSKLLNAEQSNSTIIINEFFYLKIFRRLFRDKNPDFELNEFLAEQKYFKNFPNLSGLIWWEPSPGFDISLGLMQEKLENEGDAWTWMLSEVESFFAQADAQELKPLLWSAIYPLKLKKLPTYFLQNPGQEFFKHIETLAKRTAEMHIALASNSRDRNFVVSNYNSDFTVWLKNRLIYQFDARYNLLNNKLPDLPEEAQKLAKKVLSRKDQIINFILGFDEEKLRSFRIRIHGDYHLGQILKQGKDFYILDYEGEPESTIRDRKVKQSPLKDVAGLLRSFHYALHATQVKLGTEKAKLRAEQGKSLYQAISGVFLNTYFKEAFKNQLDIGYRKEITYLLHYFLLEKAIYELGYELNGRPDWAIIPLQGILEITDEIKKI
jgi:trehalose synthase-fused probable maltokinase